MVIQDQTCLVSQNWFKGTVRRVPPFSWAFSFNLAFPVTFPETNPLGRLEPAPCAQGSEVRTVSQVSQARSVPGLIMTAFCGCMEYVGDIVGILWATLCYILWDIMGESWDIVLIIYNITQPTIMMVFGSV